MQSSLFISDLHLAPERPATVALFLDFLGRQAREAEALYILGDLFDAWIGDDDDEPPYPAIRAALRDLAASGPRCAILPGNRDFLIGRRFLADTGCDLLADPTRIDLYGTPTLLMHGDLLCTDDWAYQRFRRIIRHPLVKRLLLWRRLERRRALAQDYRRRSMAAIAGKSLAIMDVNPDAVLATLRRQDARCLIHGHTHRPADHALSLDGQPAHRLVLAEWREGRGEALMVSPSGWSRLALGSASDHT